VNESPIYVRTYEMVLWLIPELLKFPRAHRFGMAEHLQNLVMGFQDSLIAAGKAQGEKRLKYLIEADSALEQIRLWVRMSHDLRLITTRQYEHASRMQVEIGRMLGTWIKKVQAEKTGFAGRLVEQ
jgi:hypothetical protein